MAWISLVAAVNALVPIFLATIAISLLVLVLYARWNYTTLNDLGFPVMKPTFIQGSCPNIHLEVQHNEDIERMKKYGPIWGLYQGRTPLVYIADPELIKQIFVKDTQHFFDREAFNFGNKYANEILDFLPGEKWKTMRVIQTRLFSSGKLKQMSNKIFKDAAMDFVGRLKSDLVDGRAKIEARSRFQVYSIDITARSTFSMKLEDPEGPNSTFFKAIKKLAGDGQVYTSFYNWTLVFPFLARFEPTLIVEDALPDTLLSVLASRRQTTDLKFNDFADILNDCLTKTNSPDYKRLGVTEVTLVAQAINLFIAGFDRIATIMTFFAYHLALDPELQRRLHDEIDSIVHEKYNGLINYETVAEMPFLTACISETLRLYPTFIRPERVCTKDWSCPERGIRIPKGQIVMIASWAANRNPEVYEKPDQFDPERFMPENKVNLNPYAFSTFGFGHRNCIGTRFAYESLKIGLCYIFDKFRFECRNDTKLKFKSGVLMVLQYEPLYLDVIKRQ